MARKVGAIRRRFASDIFGTRSLDERGFEFQRDRPSFSGLRKRSNPSGEDSSSLQSRARTRRKSAEADAKAANRAIYEESNRRTVASIRAADNAQSARLGN